MKLEEFRSRGNRRKRAGRMRRVKFLLTGFGGQNVRPPQARSNGGAFFPGAGQQNVDLFNGRLLVRMLLSWEKEIHTHGDRLPHWEQAEATQFVTFRLGDAMPMSRVRQWREERRVWLAEHPEPWTEETQKKYHRRFTARLESWLDEGTGSCPFREAGARKVLAEALLRFHGSRVRHHAWVIIPNHLHVLFTPLVEVKKGIQGWKAASARRLGGRSIWQRNYRGTMIRDARHFGNALRYVGKIR